MPSELVWKLQVSKLLQESSHTAQWEPGHSDDDHDDDVANLRPQEFNVNSAPKCVELILTTATIIEDLVVSRRRSAPRVKF